MYWDLDEYVPNLLDFTECISLEEAEGITPSVSSLNRAGVDDLTPVDTMVKANGVRVFITEV